MPAMRERVAAVRERIAAACRRAGRPASDVEMVAVTKKHGPDAVAEAVSCGLTCFGESRVQESRQKLPMCPGGLTWHFIGHLQRNKVREAVELFSCLHAIDSLRLLEAVDAAAGEAGIDMPVLLEVNVSGEASKFGLAPEAVPGVLEYAAGLVNVTVGGLMTMAPFTPDPEAAREVFARLRVLRDGWAESTGFALEHLSMGMTHDFEVAVEEGATLVRIGTALFGGRTA